MKDGVMYVMRVKNHLILSADGQVYLDNSLSRNNAFYNEINP